MTMNSPMEIPWPYIIFALILLAGYVAIIIYLAWRRYRYGDQWLDDEDFRDD